MEKLDDKIVVRFGLKGYLYSSPMVLFLAGITVLFGILGGNDFYILLAATVVAVAFWLYYFLRLRAVYDGGVLTVRRPFGKRLTVKEQDIAFVRQVRNRYNLYDKDGGQLVQLFTYMNNAALLIAGIEERAAARRDKRVLSAAEYLEPLNALLKQKCLTERFELTYSLLRTPKQEKADVHNVPTQAENADTHSEPAQTKNADTHSEPAQTENADIHSEPAQAENAAVKSDDTDIERLPVLILRHRTDKSKRILMFIKKQETHLKFLNTSVVLSTPDTLDEAVADLFETVEDVLTSKIVTVVVVGAKGQIVNSRAFYRKQADRKAIKDAKLFKNGARVCAWSDKAAKDFLKHTFG